MFRTSVVLLSALGAAVLVAPWSASTEEALRALALPQVAAVAPFVPGEVVVQFRSGLDDRSALRAIHEAGGARPERSKFGERYRVQADAGFPVSELLRRFSSMPEVEYAEPNGTVRAFQSGGNRFAPNDPRYGLQWHLRSLDAERIWGIQRGDASVVVAVLDTGIAYEDFGPFRRAPDLAGTTFLTGFNAFNRSSHANDDNFHGTHVAGVIAQSTNNAEGVAGLAFSCGLLPVKVLDGTGFGSYFGVAEGVDYAVNFTSGGQKPVKVINLSLGGEGTSQTLASAIGRAVAAGITVVAAAGNEARTAVAFPASLDDVIAVGAVDGRKVKTGYSNSGSALDLVAYGGDIRRDDVGDAGRPDGRPDGILQQTFNPTLAEQGRYDDFALYFVTGTSQATPQVAAVAALLYRQGITDPRAIRSAIEQTAEDLGTPGRDDSYGHGLIRPVLALSGLGLNGR
jgi:serine protease